MDPFKKMGRVTTMETRVESGEEGNPRLRESFIEIEGLTGTYL